MVKDQKYRDYLILFTATFFSVFAIWIPHILKFENFLSLNFNEGFNTIYRNFDGIEYLVIAKSFYFPELIATLPQSLEAIYYAAHFPGYSLLILIFAPILGLLKSMLFTSFLFTFLSTVAFYHLIKDLKLTEKPLVLSLIFLILPARWLIVHSVGSAEPVFIFFTIMALYFFMRFEVYSKQRDIFSTALFGSLAQLTRPPGILIFVAFGLYLLFKIYKNDLNIFDLFKKYLPLILIPLTLLLIFSWYQFAYNDFWAYFHTGDNIHLTFPPFQVFNKNQSWVGEIWLEDIVYIFLLSLVGLTNLFQKGYRVLAFFVLTYLSATMLVSHRDISRYALPIFPFILIAFEKTLVSKNFRIVLLILILAIYMYAQNFILYNTAPFPNVEAFD